MFKLTADSKPAGLNSVLKEMGFEERDRALVMTRAIGSEPHDLSDADVASRPEEEWLELFFSLNSRARENQKPGQENYFLCFFLAALHHP